MEQNNKPFTDEEYQELVETREEREERKIDLSKKGKDGMLSRSAGGTQGVILKAITAIDDDKDYRQEMKLADFGSADEADEFVSALEECDVLGMSRKPIIDQMIARSAGVKHGLLYEAFRTLTHFSFFTSDNRKGRDPDKGRPQSSSPL